MFIQKGGDAEVWAVAGRTRREDLLRASVGGEHLAHELGLLLAEVVLQIVHQHDEPGLLHGHHLTEYLQLKNRNSKV